MNELVGSGTLIIIIKLKNFIKITVKIEILYIKNIIYNNLKICYH